MWPANFWIQNEVVWWKVISWLYWKLPCIFHINVFSYKSPQSVTHARMSTTGGGRGEVGFSQDCLCPESDVTLISTDRKSSAQSDDELKHKAFKRIIDICKDSISRDDIHMTIQCEKCAKCRTCKDIRKINASSYNEFIEQQAMEQLVRFV